MPDYTETPYGHVPTPIWERYRSDYVEPKDDPLRPARGIGLGVAFGLAAWVLAAVIVLAWWFH